MTIQAQPQTIFEQLLPAVFEALQTRKIDELQLRRWEREAEKLLRASRGEGLEVKAHLAAIRGDDDESDRLYFAALQSTNDYTGAAVRYLSVLSQRLRPEKLLEVYHDVGDAFKGNPEASRFVEELLAHQGFIVSAWKLSDELTRMGSYSSASPLSDSERATQTIEVEGFDDLDFGAPVAFAKRFLRARKLELKGTSVTPCVSDESAAVVFFQFRIDSSPEEAIDAEMDLFDALAREPFSLEHEGKVVLALVGTRAVLADGNR